MIILEWWVFYMKDYKFYTLESHYQKHVEGKDKDDKRPNNIKLIESNHWHDYKNVSNKDLYYDAAIDNISISKRVYKYRAYDGSLSINYQKGCLTYYDNMGDDKYEQLLTTCLNVRETNIKTCFYRTISFDNIELLNMVYAVFISNKSIVNTSANIHIDGFNLNTFTEELMKLFFDLYEEYYVIPKYNKKTALKMILVSVLKKKLKKDETIMYEILIKLVNDFIDAYNEGKIYKVSLTRNDLEVLAKNLVVVTIGIYDDYKEWSECTRNVIHELFNLKYSDFEKC